MRKKDPHCDPNDPSRHRANKQRGRGTYANDCVPIVGLVCRETGSARFQVCPDTTTARLQEIVSRRLLLKRPVKRLLFTPMKTARYGLNRKTNHENEWRSITPPAGRPGRGWNSGSARELGRGHLGGLRNRLRLFRSVHKDYLFGYVAMFGLAFNNDHVSLDILKNICGL